MPTTVKATMRMPVPDSASCVLRPSTRIRMHSTKVPMISVTRFCTGLSISGPVEKIPSVGSSLAWNWPR